MEEGFRKVLYSKIHRARVTHADVHYEGSITLSPELLDAAGLKAYEAVHVWNVTNGNRFETYTIEGEPKSLDIAVNGAAARLVTPGDIIIIANFTWIPESRLESHEPKLVFVDEHNKILPARKEIPGPRIDGIFSWR